jgi:hypothetical protein
MNHSDSGYQIEKWEKESPTKLNEQQKLLRDKVEFIHEKVEESVDILLARFTYSDVIGKIEGTAKYVLESNISFILNTADFSRKVKMASDLSLIREKGGLEKIRYLNELRNWFAHPKAYYFQLEQFKEGKYVNTALEKVVEVKKLIDRAVKAFKVGDKKIKTYPPKKGMSNGFYWDFNDLKKSRDIFIIGNQNHFTVIEANYSLT